MKARVIALIALLLPMPGVAQQGATEIQFDSVADFFKLPDGMNFGEVSGVAVNSKGHMLRVHALEQRGRPGLRPHRCAVAGVRSRGQVRARDRQGQLRVVLRSHGAHRQGRQHLGRGQGLGHGHQVQSAGADRLGVRAAGGIGRRRSQGVGARRIHRWRRSTDASASQPTSRGIRKATSTSRTDT